MTEPITRSRSPPPHVPLETKRRTPPCGTHPATPAEVDCWLTVLHQRGHLHHAQPGPDTTWTVQRERHDRLWSLHHSVIAMERIEELVREIRQQNPETSW
ncbi:hypothetical protein AB0B13_21560 [Streptomyces sp. NPDC042898]|uniref:hypothetical protein n=1 Tax=Streptomyces sp. NPDC042898 TaxID=3154334 RepID=UPI0033DF2221